MSDENNWCPTRFERFESANDESSTKVSIISTDDGRAYLKALGNPEGPHALAREWVGTSLARWFGLSTFDFAIIQLEPGFEVPLGGGHLAEAGSAFVSRALDGFPWSREESALQKLVNAEDLTKLVMLDTWLLNADRFSPKTYGRDPNYDNVFIAVGDGSNETRLIAMDFTECLKVMSHRRLGTSSNEIIEHTESKLTSSIARIEHIKNDHIFGLFPEFVRFLRIDAYQEGIGRLQQATQTELETIVAGIPSDWDVPGPTRKAIVDFLVQRARFLVEELLPGAFHPYLATQGGLPES